MANYVISECISKINVTCLSELRELALHDFEAAKKLFDVPDMFVRILKSMTPDECRDLGESIQIPIFSPNQITADGWNAISALIKRSNRTDKDKNNLNRLVISTTTWTR